MSDVTRIECRDDVARFAGANIISPRGTQYRSQQVAKWEPDYFELAREGRIFVCSPGVKAQWVAPVTDDPGTASAYTLYNPTTSTQVLVPLRVWGIQSGTLGTGGALVVAHPQKEATAVTANTTGVLVKSTSGSQRTFPGFWATGVTLDAAGAWQAVGSAPTIASTHSAIVAADLGGQYIVRPGYAMGTHWLATAGTSPLLGIGMVVAVLDAKMFD